MTATATTSAVDREWTGEDEPTDLICLFVKRNY